MRNRGIGNDKDVLMGDNMDVDPDKLKILMDRVLIKRDLQTKVTKGGILVPQVAKAPAFTGIVLRLGKIKNKDYLSLKEGDHVQFLDERGMDLVMREENYVVIEIDEILGVLNEKTQTGP